MLFTGFSEGSDSRGYGPSRWRARPSSVRPPSTIVGWLRALLGHDAADFVSGLLAFAGLSIIPPYYLEARYGLTPPVALASLAWAVTCLMFAFWKFTRWGDQADHSPGE